MVTIKQYYGYMDACKYWENIETFVFVLGNAARLLLKLYFKTLDKIYD